MGNIVVLPLAVALVAGCLAYYGLWLAAGVVVALAVLLCMIK